MRESVTQYGRPEIFTTDQGCQFPRQEFTGLLKDHGIQISMDGTGWRRDNVFVERLWRSAKHEETYLWDCADRAEGWWGGQQYVLFYNMECRHHTLDRRTQTDVHFG